MDLKIRGVRVRDIITRINIVLRKEGTSDSRIRYPYIIIPPRILSISCIFGGKNKRVVSYMSLFSQILRKRFAVLIWLPFSVYKIRIKNNIRVYRKSGNKLETIKIQRITEHPRGNKNSLVNEINTRNKLHSNPKLPIAIPQLYSSHTSDIVWLREEYIGGDLIEKKNKVKIVKAFIRQMLVDYYLEYIDFECIGISLEKLNLGNVAKLEEWIAPLRFKEEFNINLSQLKDKVWPLSLCHGNLSLGNMLFRSNAIYIIDWEESAKLPVAFDVFALGRKISALNEALSLISKLNVALSYIVPIHIAIATPIEQYFSYLVEKCTEFLLYRDGRIQYNMMVNNRSLKESEINYNDTFDLMINELKTLCKKACF